MNCRVEALCVGQPEIFRGEELSAIGKHPVNGQVRITFTGLEGDAQADRVHHGGVDMAVHHYPHDHYAGWEEWLGGHELLSRPAAFGENIHAGGLTERDVCIGDRFRLGGALLEVSQPRKPCWKIEHRFGRKGMLARILRSHICGWYYRVIEEGMAEAGDTLELIERRESDWPIARAFATLLDPTSAPDGENLRALAALEALSSDWRKKAAAKAENSG
ncbi:MOSC domain-containing protein [Altererythrobacter sp.]|uniref:MOSC domain-containing protein n=1 Tax=Altererythrobacter sp. TaxID=1872480 RepID=UPI003D07697B